MISYLSIKAILKAEGKLKKYLLIILSLFFTPNEIAFSQIIGTPNNKNVISLKIRSKPNKYSTILANVSNGDELEITAINSSNYWFKVKYKGITGWVSGKYIDIIGSNPPEENNEGNRPPSANIIPDISESASKSQVKDIDQSKNIALSDKTESDDYNWGSNPNPPGGSNPPGGPQNP